MHVKIDNKNLVYHGIILNSYAIGNTVHILTDHGSYSVDSTQKSTIVYCREEKHEDGSFGGYHLWASDKLKETEYKFPGVGNK
jgi:hypothetical protein